MARKGRSKIAISSSDLSLTGTFTMKYSNKLLTAFQHQHLKTFGTEIDLQVAEAELDKLAHLVKQLYIKNETND